MSSVCVEPTELQALHEMVQQKVVTLLSDSENIVKQSLMENGITRLCVFFGRQKANDVLLSHMITFLNDKNDWHLRGAFFDSIVGRTSSVSPSTRFDNESSRGSSMFAESGHHDSRLQSFDSVMVTMVVSAADEETAICGVWF